MSHVKPQAMTLRYLVPALCIVVIIGGCVGARTNQIDRTTQRVQLLLEHRENIIELLGYLPEEKWLTEQIELLWAMNNTGATDRP